MQILEYILWGVLILIGGYVVFRVFSMAVFKSWIDSKTINSERRKKDGDQKHVGRSGRDNKSNQN